MAHVITIDCDYLRPRFAAAYLIHEGEQAAFIDNNTSHSVPLLLKALAAAGLKPEQVKYVIITHVHLDHSGGSSLLMKACPQAKLLAHPRAVPHLIDPARLIAGAQAVYGVEQFARLYGEIAAISAERVRSVEDGQVLDFGESGLRFFFTRGHANHHLCVELSDHSKKVVFTGDAFGLAYPDLQKGGLFVIPSTSPTDFDASEARRSVDLILSSRAQVAYPTHFGAVTDLAQARAQILEMIDFSENLLAQAQHSDLPDSELSAFCETRIWTEIGERLKARGLSLGDRLLSAENVRENDSETIGEFLKLDIELNAQGLAWVAVKRRHPREAKK